MTGGDFSCVESSYREDSLHRRLCMTGGYDLGCALPPSKSVRVGFVDVGALSESVCAPSISGSWLCRCGVHIGVSRCELWLAPMKSLCR